MNGVIRRASEAGLQGIVGSLGRVPVVGQLARSAAGAIAIDALAGIIEDAVIDPFITDRLTNGVEDFFDRFQPALSGSYH